MEHSTRLWDAPDPTDAPATEDGSAPRSAPPVRIGGMRRGIVTALLAGGLLVIGGVAAVAAADPSASPDASPIATQPADPGSSAQPDDQSDGSARQHGDCPAKDGSGSSSGGSDDGGSESSPDASPNASDSDV